jgi:hypothetical protein
VLSGDPQALTMAVHRAALKDRDQLLRASRSRQRRAGEERRREAEADEGARAVFQKDSS